MKTKKKTKKYKKKKRNANSFHGEQDLSTASYILNDFFLLHTYTFASVRIARIAFSRFSISRCVTRLVITADDKLQLCIGKQLWITVFCTR